MKQVPVVSFYAPYTSSGTPRAFPQVYFHLGKGARSSGCHTPLSTLNISSTHETQAKSVDDYTEKENFIHGRGYGGVAIFWRKDIDHAIKSHDDGNERINVITVNMKEHLLCIINVYMPSDNSNRDEQ